MAILHATKSSNSCRTQLKSSKRHSRNTLTFLSTTMPPRTRSDQKMPYQLVICLRVLSRIFRARTLKKARGSYLLEWSRASSPMGEPSLSITQMTTQNIRAISKGWPRFCESVGWITSQRSWLSAQASNARRGIRTVVVGGRCSASQTSSHVTRRSKTQLEHWVAELSFCRSTTAS